MKIAIGADHGGFHLKNSMVKFLLDKNYEVLDLGADSVDPSDYPDFARAVAEAVLSGRAERGILICGSGVGVSVAANKFPEIRAALCHDTYSAHQGVEHDDMNVLCLGAWVVGPELAKEIVRNFISAGFSNVERHVRRLNKVKDIEQEYSKPERSSRGKAWK